MNVKAKMTQRNLLKSGGWFLLLGLVLPFSVSASSTHGGETKLDRETLEFTKDWTKHHNPKITFMVKDQGRFIMDLESDNFFLAKAFIKDVMNKKMDNLSVTEYADGITLKVDAGLIQKAKKISHLHEYKKGVVALKLSDESNPRLYICTRPPKTFEGYVPIGDIIEGMEILENLKPDSLVRDAFVSPHPPLKEQHH